MSPFLIDSINPIDLLKEAYIGKEVRLCVSSKQIIQPYSVEIKRSGSVTEKQFESGHKRFRMIANRTKIIGSHRIFETHKITNVYIDEHCDYYQNYSVKAMLSNGIVIDLIDSFKNE